MGTTAFRDFEIDAVHMLCIGECSEPSVFARLRSQADLATGRSALMMNRVTILKAWAHYRTRQGCTCHKIRISAVVLEGSL